MENTNIPNYYPGFNDPRANLEIEAILKAPDCGKITDSVISSKVQRRAGRNS
jgi:hypothetical protein